MNEELIIANVCLVGAIATQDITSKYILIGIGVFWLFISYLRYRAEHL